MKRIFLSTVLLCLAATARAPYVADNEYEDAWHLHDAAWYVTGKGKGREQEVYILFKNWNPSGIGALKLVNSWE